jgi:hypothetical protein
MFISFPFRRNPRRPERKIPGSAGKVKPETGTAEETQKRMNPA